MPPMNTPAPAGNFCAWPCQYVFCKVLNVTTYWPATATTSWGCTSGRVIMETFLTSILFGAAIAPPGEGRLVLYTVLLMAEPPAPVYAPPCPIWNKTSFRTAVFFATDQKS